MNTIMDILHTYKEVITIGLVLLMAQAVLKRYWDEINFRLMDFFYGLPLIGKVARLSKSLEFNSQSRWFYAEEELAQAYINHHHKVRADPEYFDKCNSYLDRAGEMGRSPFAWYLWVLVFIMVAIEAMGFSYVLAGFTIPGASENVLKLGALGISVLISVLLVGFTHWTGKELYTNALVAKARSWWSHDNRDGAKLVESSHEISIEKNDADKSEPRYVQLLNRVPVGSDAEKRYWMTISTAILVIAIAIGATWVRGVVLEKELQDETTGSLARINQGQAQSFFPKTLTAPQIEADKKGVEEAANLDRQGGWGTFIVLAVIFVFMQIFGVLTGYKFGFVGKESAKAYATISRFNTRAAYEAKHKARKDGILRTGGRRLLELQQRLNRNVRIRGTTPEQKDAASYSETRDIHAYLERVLQQEDETNRQEQKRNAARAIEQLRPLASTAHPVIQIDETDDEIEARIRAEMQGAADEARRQELRAREAKIRARLEAEKAK